MIPLHCTATVPEVVHVTVISDVKSVGTPRYGKYSPNINGVDVSEQLIVALGLADTGLKGANTKTA